MSPSRTLHDRAHPQLHARLDGPVPARSGLRGSPASVIPRGNQALQRAAREQSPLLDALLVGRGALGNQQLIRASQGVTAPARPAGTLATVQRKVTLTDKKGKPYPNPRKKELATAQNVLDWVFEHLDARRRDQLAKDLDKLKAFCEDSSVDITLDGANAQATYKEFASAFETYVAPVASKEEKKEEEGGVEVDEDEPEVGRQLELMGLSPLATTLLQLEGLLQPIVTALKRPENKSKKSQVMQSQVGEIEGKILGVLETLLQMLSAPMSELDFAQVIRFWHTIEYGVLAGSTSEVSKLAKKLDSKIVRLEKASHTAEHEQTQTSLAETLETQMFIEITEILPLEVDPQCDQWPKQQRSAYLLEVLQKTYQKLLSSVHYGKHGATSTSSKATPLQLIAGFGELMLCKPMILQILPIAFRLTDLLDWDPKTLIVKILQQTVRRYKVQSILELMTGLDVLCPTLLGLTKVGRISPLAFGSIKEKLQEFVGGNVIYKGKEQLRILNLLAQVLNADQSLTCVNYEKKVGDSAPADIVLKGSGQKEATPNHVIEVESIPESIRKEGSVYDYLCKRFEIKMGTVGKHFAELGYGLVIAIPLGVQLFESDAKKVKSDPRFIYFG